MIFYLYGSDWHIFDGVSRVVSAGVLFFPLNSFPKIWRFHESRFFLLFTVICRLNVHHGLSHVNTCAPLACCLIFFGLIVFDSAFSSFLFRPRELQAMVFLSFENPWFEILKKKWTNLEISVEAGSSAVLSGMVETVIILSHFFMIISVDERQH